MIPLASDDDWLLSLPLFHVSGQGILWRWLLAGARLTVGKGNRWNRHCKAVRMLRWCPLSSGGCSIARPMCR
jgi:acyl-CoA synthetase (AMP-forming)/AMP-acid ligase II